MTQPSLSPSSSFTYDVFLSFRGIDTRNTFIRDLYNSLDQKGIHTFFDEEEIQKGEEITPSILQAIHQSRIFIVVFSNNYASSTFCLNELVMILECSNTRGRLLLPVFYDVEPSQVRHQSGAYGDALKKHEKRFSDDKVQKWRDALCKAAEVYGWHFKHGSQSEYNFIGNIVEEVTKKINRTPLHVADNPVALESPVADQFDVGDMARPFSFIADLNDKKDFWKLAVKVLDRWTVVKDGKEHSEMVIVDAKGNDIQVLIPTGYKSQYEKLIKEKSTYTLSNFQVQMNDLVFKASEHRFKLIWTGGTTADQVNVHQIPDVALKFKPLAEIAAGRWRPDLLIHVIGYVHEVGYCQMNEGTSKKLQVNVLLKDSSDIPLNCTLWEEYAAKFIKFSNERKEAGPIVVMLKYAKVKEEGKYPLSVTSTYGVTKLFINDNIAEINTFKESLPKQDQLECQSQLMCTQTFNGSQFDTEDEILGNNLIRPLSEIIQLDQITYCVTAVRVEKVKSTRFGWYYLVCCKCPKVARGDKPPYTCDSGHNTETEIVRYKLELDVSYEDTKSTFVMWDREVSQLLGISAAQLRLNMIEAGITNRLEYPKLIDCIGQKSMIFKVKWQPRWKTSSVVSFKEGDAICELIKSKYPNAPVLTLPDDSTEVVDKPSDNFSVTDDTTMSIPELSGTVENDVEMLSQLTPMSEKSTTPSIKQRSSDQITPAKRVSVPALPLPDAYDDITPAKHSSSKRVKLIKTEKK